MLRAAAPQSEVHCETRRRLPLPQHATWRQQRAVAHPDMDKNIYAAVCLVYARAIQAPFLALTDLDELPPGKLAAVLREKRGSSAVVRVFFDADHACGGVSVQPRRRVAAMRQAQENTLEADRAAAKDAGR